MVVDFVLKRADGTQRQQVSSRLRFKQYQRTPVSTTPSSAATFPNRLTNDVLDERITTPESRAVAAEIDVYVESAGVNAPADD